MSIGLLLGGGAQGLTAGINAGNSIMDRKRRDKRDAESDQRYQDSLTHRNAQEAQADSRYKAGIKYRDSNNDLNRARQKKIDAQNQKTAELQQQVASNKLSAYQLAKETKAVENYMLAASRDGAGSVLNSTSRGKALMDQYGLEDFDIQGLDNADGSRGYHILGKPKGKDWSLLGANGQPLQGHEQSAPLSQAGLVAFTSHALGVSQEAVDAAFGNQQRLKLTSAKENAKMDKVQAGKVEIANIKADKPLNAANLKFFTEQANLMANQKSSLFTSDEKTFGTEGRQVWVLNKAMELANSFQNGDEANSQPQSEPQTVALYQPKHAALWGEPSSKAPAPKTQNKAVQENPLPAKAKAKPDDIFSRLKSEPKKALKEQGQYAAAKSKYDAELSRLKKSKNYNPKDPHPRLYTLSSKMRVAKSKLDMAIKKNRAPKTRGIGFASTRQEIR